MRLIYLCPKCKFQTSDLKKEGLAVVTQQMLPSGKRAVSFKNNPCPKCGSVKTHLLFDGTDEEVKELLKNPMYDTDGTKLN